MLASLFIILNIFFIETMLSIDNVAVLALLVRDLPNGQKTKALRYGIFGAFLFRGLSLVFASFLVKFWFLKIIGGGYLLYLTYNFFRTKEDEEEEVDKEHNPVYQRFMKWIGAFWSTVVLVEFMDMTFSVDNIFAASAISSNLYFVVGGVFTGILGIRFIAGWFVDLMERFPELESSAFIVIGFLGLKLVVTSILEAIPSLSNISRLVSGTTFELNFSAVMLLIFFVPVLYSLYKNR